MRASAVLGALALLLTPGGPARADEPLPVDGPYAALRAGVGAPWGNLQAGGPKVSDHAGAKLPLGLDLGYRLNERIWVQLYTELAPSAAPRARCAEAADCTASDARFGVEVLFRFRPGAGIEPWVGLGAGLEVLKSKGRDPESGQRFSWSFTGVELPVIEVGADVALADFLALGPWLSATFARYTTGAAALEGGGEAGESIKATGIHGWLAAGVKLTLKL